jgi:hypothetical protein
MPPNPSDTKSVAEDMSQLSETLNSLQIEGSGELADEVRANIAKSGKQAQILAEAARSVHSASEKYRENAARYVANAPTDEQIEEAQRNVVLATERAAAGTGSETEVQEAVDSLGKLLAAREAADKDKETSDEEAGIDLKNGTGDLDDPNKNPALADLMRTLQQAQQMPPQMPPQMPMAPAGAMPMADPGQVGGSPVSPDFSDYGDLSSSFDPASSSSSGGSWDDFGSGTAGSDDDFEFTPDYSSNGTELTDGVAPSYQPPTLTGVNTPADVSGRPNAPFTVVPSVSGAGTPGMGAAGTPMAPMMPMGGMGGMGAGGAGGPGANPTKILTSDPYFTGQDIDDELATDGVIRDSEK